MWDIVWNYVVVNKLYNLHKYFTII